MKRKLTALFCMLALAVGLTACSNDDNQAPANQNEPAAGQTEGDGQNEAGEPGQERQAPQTRIAMSTAASGTLYYAAGIAVTQLWIEELPGTVASASSSSGSQENALLLINGETNMGIIQSNIIRDAYYGDNDYAGEPHPELRILAPLTSAPYHILARKDANMNCLADARGTRFCVGLAGSGNMTTISLLFDAIGMSFDDIKTSNISMNESIEAMKNGLLDATIIFGQYPNSTVVDALSSPGSNLTLVPFSEEEIEPVTSANNWIVRDLIPAGTYTDQEEDWPTLSHNGYICVTEDFPEEEAYTLVMTIFENLDWLYETYAPLDCYAMNNPWPAVQSTDVPLHPGAERAFQELGFI